MNFADLLIGVALATTLYGLVVALARHRQSLTKTLNAHRGAWLVAAVSALGVGVGLLRGEAGPWDPLAWPALLRQFAADATTPPRVKVAVAAVFLGLVLLALMAWCWLALPRDPSTFRGPRDRRAAFRYYVGRLSGGLDYALLAGGDGERLGEEADARQIEALCPHLPPIPGEDGLPRRRAPEDQVRFWREAADRVHRRMAEPDAVAESARHGRGRRVTYDAEHGGFFFQYLRPPGQRDAGVYLFGATLNRAEMDSRRADHHFHLLLEALLNIELTDPVTRHMRKDFTRLRDGETIGAALARLHQHPPEGRVLYFYVVDAEDHLLGVVPTRRLLLNPPEAAVRDIMVKPVIAIPDTATVLDACEFFTLHKLLAFPVVDDERRVLGVVDVELYTEELIDIERREANDDLFQLIGVHLVEARQGDLRAGFRQRFPWLLTNITGGLLAGALAAAYEDVSTLAVVVPFIPVVLALSESVSIQSVSLALQTMQGWRPTWAGLAARARRELAVGLALGGACGLLVGLVALAWMRSAGVAASLLGGITGGVGVAAVLGLGMPLLLRLLRRDPQVAAGPIALACADLVSLLVYFNLARWLLR